MSGQHHERSAARAVSSYAQPHMSQLTESAVTYLLMIVLHMIYDRRFRVKLFHTLYTAPVMNIESVTNTGFMMFAQDHQ